MIAPHCQSFHDIWQRWRINAENFTGFVSEFLGKPATLLRQWSSKQGRKRKTLPANQHEEGKRTADLRGGGGQACYLEWSSDQALLRRGASAARRFAMNAARRVPRAQGMTVSFSAAAFVIDLMKRALVFMSLVLSICVVMGRCPCLRLNMTVQSGRFWAICGKLHMYFAKVRGRLGQLGPNLFRPLQNRGQAFDCAGIGNNIWDCFGRHRV